MIKIVPFEPNHARHIFQLRKGLDPVSSFEERLIQGYTSTGSVAKTLMSCGNIETPLACGGIINLDWHRGEAWILEGPGAKYHRLSLWKSFIGMIPYLAELGGFRRVQACCFDLTREKFFRLLGFEREGVLKSFGPSGEDSAIFSRIFL